jgi:hypothetical protein
MTVNTRFGAQVVLILQEATVRLFQKHTLDSIHDEGYSKNTLDSIHDEGYSKNTLDTKLIKRRFRKVFFGYSGFLQQ